MKTLSILLLLLSFISCGTVYVEQDYDTQKSFDTYKTFAFYPDLKTGLNELDDKRLKTATTKLMNAKGFVISDKPDIYINFKSNFYDTPNRNSVGVGVGGSGVNIGMGGSLNIGIPQTFIEITTDFIDAKTNELIWQAIAEKRYRKNTTVEEKTALIHKIMGKTLEKYPPKNKK